MATVAKFRIDVAIHDLLMNSSQRPPEPAEPKGLTLPEPVFPQYPDRLTDPGPETPPEKRQWGRKDVYRYSRGWLVPYIAFAGVAGRVSSDHRISISSSTNAIWIAGTAGLTTTRSKE